MLYLEEDLHKLLDMVRRADIPPPSTVRGDIPPQLDRIAMRALAKRPDDRYQTAGDLATDLERFLHAYAPVFTANRVAGWMQEVLGLSGAPSLMEREEREKQAARAREPERERGETRRLTKEQLIRARSEFTDENSIIYSFAGSPPGDDRGGRDSMDETSTFDSPLPDDHVDGLPAAPRPVAAGSAAGARAGAGAGAGAADEGGRRASTSDERPRSGGRPAAEPGGPLAGPAGGELPPRTLPPGDLAPRTLAPGDGDSVAGADLMSLDPPTMRRIPAARPPGGRPSGARPPTAQPVMPLAAPPDSTPARDGDAVARGTGAAGARGGEAAGGAAGGPAGGPDGGPSPIAAGRPRSHRPGTARGADEATRLLHETAPPSPARDDESSVHTQPVVGKAPISGPGAGESGAIAGAFDDEGDDDGLEDETLDPSAGDDADTNDELDDATIISAPPGFYAGVGEPTDIAGPPGAMGRARPPDHRRVEVPGEPTVVEGGRPTAGDDDETADADRDATTLLNAPPVKRRSGEQSVPAHEAPTAWEAAPALSANVHQPAVSALRQPRESRRTPPGGVLASILSPPGADTRAPQVAMSPTTPLIGGPDVVGPGAPGAVGPGAVGPGAVGPGAVGPGAVGPGGPGAPGPGAIGPGAIGSRPPPPPAGAAAHGALVQPGPFPPPAPFSAFGPPPATGPFTTRQLAASLELDEIPDKFKIRRRRHPSPVWIAVGALVLAAVVASVLIAIYGTGSGESQAATTAPIEVVSSPPGAAVTVDGKAVDGKTPVTFQGTPGRKVLIGLDLPGHQRWERELTIPPEGGAQQVVARLDPVVVKIKVRSTPPGAEVFVNDTSVGHTPLELGGLDPQSSKVIELRLRGYRPVRRTLEWSKGETEKHLEFKLEP